MNQVIQPAILSTEVDVDCTSLTTEILFVFKKKYKHDKNKIHPFYDPPQKKNVFIRKRCRFNKSIKINQFLF